MCILRAKMNIINEAEIVTISIIGTQKIIPEKVYRLINYVYSIRLDDSLLLYNCLTNELILLDSTEEKVLYNINTENEIVKALIKKWFIVPQDFSESIFCNQINNIMNLAIQSNLKTKPLANYTIFTTTECNARCFYCYEAGAKKFSMSDKVANDVADYIIKHAKNETIKINWFGGEPLYNFKVIDTISSILRKNGASYTSKMVSNGYLFDDNIIARATKLWNLKKVQITLDGTEEIYNKCKAYITTDDISPFRKVIDNIKKLVANDIQVTVRLNMDNHNYENLFKLVDYLAAEFIDKKNIGVYVKMLYDEFSNMHCEDDRVSLYKKFMELNDYIYSKNIACTYGLKKFLKYQNCTADADNATTVLPDGRLGKCEHYIDGNFWGSIYSENKDYEVLNRFKERIPHTKDCEDCCFLPNCIKLKECSNTRVNCGDDEIKLKLYDLNRRISNTYRRWRDLHK